MSRTLLAVFVVFSATARAVATDCVVNLQDHKFHCNIVGGRITTCLVEPRAGKGETDLNQLFVYPVADATTKLRADRPYPIELALLRPEILDSLKAEANVRCAATFGDLSH